MKYIRTNSLKRLFSLKRRSFDGEEDEPNNNNNKNKNRAQSLDISEPFQRPIWRCFSFEEISIATDSFSPGFPSLSLYFSRETNKQTSEQAK